MKRTFLSVAVALTAFALSTGGCALDADPDTSARQSALDGSLGAGTYPVLVDIPLGSTDTTVCTHDDGDTKKALADYARANGKSVSHPSSDTTKWQRRGNAFVCDFCDLDDHKISVYANETLIITNSSMKNASFNGTLGANLTLENVYARGASFHFYGLKLGAKNADLRCSKTTAIVEAFEVTAANQVDFSGMAPAALLFTGDAKDVRFTGTKGSPHFRGGNVENARFDGVSVGDVQFERAVVRGVTRFDHAGWFTVQATDTTFLGGRVITTGANGRLAGRGVVTFDGVDLLDADTGFLVDMGGASAIHATNGTRWPVGTSHLVDDAQLPLLDFGGKVKGASLVTKKDETWPAAGTALSLDKLKLTHGALPIGADLTRASLNGAALERVDFSQVTLSRGTTQHAMFNDARLAQADFGGANIDAVDFTSADLRGAKFAGAHGTATLVKAKAGILPAHVDDNDTDVPKITSFARASLQATRFDQAILQYADFTQAHVAEAHFDLAILDGATLEGAELARAGVPNITFGKAASVHAVSLNGADLRGVSLDNLDFGPLAGKRASFVGAFLCGASLRNTKLRDADLSSVFFDVSGNVRFPDGTKGACVPKDKDARANADTSSLTEIKTACPNGGHAPAGTDGMCTDAQWKVQGEAADTCTAEEKKFPLDDGADCTKDCQCQSLFCDVKGTVGKAGTCQED